MRPSTQRFAVLVGFAALLALVVANGFITRRQLETQIQKRKVMSHTREVMLEIARTGSVIKDAETGQRGFLITQDPSYLEPYNQALRQIGVHRDRLRSRTPDNSFQQSRISQLDVLIKDRLDELASTISLAQSGRTEEARAMVLTNSGKHTMDRIRNLLEEMWQDEIKLEEQQSVAYQESTRRTAWSIYLATFVAVLAILFVWFLVLRELRIRERHALAVRQSEEWFRVTLNSIGDGVIATDSTGAVTFMNQVAESITGRTNSDFKDRSVTDVFPIFNENTNEPVENPVGRVISSGRIIGLANHTVLVRSDGQRIPIEDSAAPIRDDRNQIVGVVLVFRDATQDRHAQQLLRRAEKLAAAGRLASTMAHEINNPLEAVANLLYLVRLSPELSAQSREYIVTAEQQLDRVSHITRQTLGFYRESTSAAEVHLPSVVESVLKLYDNKLRSKRISVECQLDSVPPISALAGELRQLIANLVSNSIDAMEANGKLSIVGNLAELHGTSGVEIRIADTGPGISPEHAERIFEPFFTTKADIGTGLGLWVAREIAERHGGELRLVSNGHQTGAVFTVFLPLNTKSREAASA